MNNQLNDKLGNLVAAGGGKIHTGPFGSQLHASDYVQQGIPCIMPANMKNNRVDLSNIALIREEDAQRLSKYIVRENDIVYSRRGDVTQKALIREKEAGYFCGTGCLLLRPGKKLDARFLTNYLSTPKIRNWIVSQAVGATMPNLNTGILSSVPFHGPEKEEQEKIADVLSVIEDKIEFNNRINAELEAMAKTLYDYWFVQFDFPNAKGKPYKTSGGKMVYSSTLKREIPEGWEARKIGDISQVKAGGDKPAEFSEFKNNKNQIPIFSNGVIDDGLYGYTNKATIDKPSISVSARGTIGFSVLRMRPFVPIIRLLVLTPFEKSDLKLIDESIKWIEFENSGSVQQQLTVPQISSLYILYPPSECRKKYSNLVASSVTQIDLLKEQNQELKVLRDWLLPMLMNGQVTVK